MLGQAWRTIKQTLGNVHPKLAQVLAALATLKARQKKSVEAQQLLRRSIAIWRHMGAGSHPALLTALKMLTKLCFSQGKHHNLGMVMYILAPVHIAYLNPLSGMQHVCCYVCTVPGAALFVIQHSQCVLAPNKRLCVWHQVSRSGLAHAGKTSRPYTALPGSIEHGITSIYHCLNKNS